MKTEQGPKLPKWNVKLVISHVLVHPIKDFNIFFVSSKCPKSARCRGGCLHLRRLNRRVIGQIERQCLLERCARDGRQEQQGSTVHPADRKQGGFTVRRAWQELPTL